jgi:hypothetical protein
MLSDAIEQKLEDVIDRVPGSSEVRPLIESTVQVALAAKAVTQAFALNLAADELAVTTVVSRSPTGAWVVRSLFGSLRNDVRGLRGGVPIPARASS